MNVSKQKVGLMMDISTESVIVLLPVATAFVGFMVSLVEGSISELHLDMSAYHVFLLSILFNFFAIVTLIIGIILTFWTPGKKTNLSNRKTDQEQLEEEEHEFHRSGIKRELSLVKAQPWNLIFPVFLLLGLSLFLLWQDGIDKGAKSIFEAFRLADATFVMLLAVFITLILTFVFYIIKTTKIDELLYHFYDGGNQMMEAISLLVLIWSLTLSAEDLGFSNFISSTLGSFLPAFLTPANDISARLCCRLLYRLLLGHMGIVYAAWMLLAVSTGASIPLTVGAVFASGAFGALASPLGDTTITTASILDLPLVDYARYKLKVSVIGGVIAIVLYLVSALFLF